MTSLRRVARILWTVSRYRLDTLLAPYTPAGYRWLLRVSPLRLLPAGKYPEGVRLKLALQDLGPVFVKFGQLLSTRRDLIPLAIADELAKLQDAVPPFPSEQARTLVETALGKSITDAFADFIDDPIASASVAQVHAATLPDGSAVVVKIVRPDITTVIEEDIAVLGMLAGWLEEHVAEARRLHLSEVVTD